MVLASIRKISGKKKLKKLKLKSASPVPFGKIKTIGVIFYIDNETDLKNLSKIQKNAFFEGRDVQVLCWLKATKKKPHPMIDGVRFVDRIDFNTNFLPSSKATRYFADQDFDLLLDLTSEYHFPMHALSVMSNARLKAGMDHKLNWHLQVKIKPSEARRNSSSYLLDQIVIYLEKLFPS